MKATVTESELGIRVINAMISNYKLLSQDFISKSEWEAIRNAYKQLFSEEEWEEVTDKVGTYVHTLVIKRNYERINK